MTRCLGCRAEIGPTESRDCPTNRQSRGLYLTHADQAVLALESAAAPISIYDIQRFFQSEFGWAPSRMSLNATVAQDRRCCWAGRGLYGLWRHGVFPGPRRLIDVVRVVLYARASPLPLDELAFVLRQIGYRFQSATLYNVLNQWPTIQERRWHHYTNKEENTEIAASLRMTTATLDAISERVRRQTRAALRERRRRLAAERGLRDTDPVFAEGQIEPAGPFG